MGGLVGTDITGYTDPPFTRFRGPAGSANWFTFPIPTPVIKDDRRTRLAKVFALYHTPSDQVTVFRVDVYDGRHGIHNVTPNTFGNHMDVIDSSNSWTIPASTPEVRFGISIVVGVRFNQEGDITFSAVGADFTT